jgi:murein DD-endopeptidase MepM/ murein hydrolase activator NlpD
MKWKHTIWLVVIVFSLLGFSDNKRNGQAQPASKTGSDLLKIDSVAYYDSMYGVTMASIDKYTKDSVAVLEKQLAAQLKQKTQQAPLNIQLFKKVIGLEALLLMRARNFQDLYPIISNMRSYSPNFTYVPAILPCHPNSINRFSSPFGYRFHPKLKVRKLHAGLDIAAPSGIPVFATADGLVIKSGYDRGYGNFIVVRHAFGFETLYGHLSARWVEKGQMLSRGKIIGLVGSTGLSTGPHLHYEVHKNGAKIDPIRFTNFAISVFLNDMKKNPV